MKKGLNYTMCLFEKDEDSIAKQALLVSVNFHSSGITSFYSNNIVLSKSYFLPNFVPNNLEKTKISRYKEPSILLSGVIQLIMLGDRVL